MERHGGRAHGATEQAPGRVCTTGLSAIPNSCKTTGSSSLREGSYHFHHWNRRLMMPEALTPMRQQPSHLSPSEAHIHSAKSHVMNTSRGYLQLM